MKRVLVFIVLKVAWIGGFTGVIYGLGKATKQIPTINTDANVFLAGVMGLASIILIMGGIYYIADTLFKIIKLNWSLSERIIQKLKR